LKPEALCTIVLGWRLKGGRQSSAKIHAPRGVRFAFLDCARIRFQIDKSADVRDV